MSAAMIIQTDLSIFTHVKSRRICSSRSDFMRIGHVSGPMHLTRCVSCSGYKMGVCMGGVGLGDGCLYGGIGAGMQ